MSYFVPSALVAGQAKFTEAFQKGEWRLPDSVALNAAQKSLIANPQLGDIRTREDRTVYAYFPIRQTATTGTARAHNHTGARGDSLSKTLSWSTFSEPFSISLKQGDNNVFTFAEMYASSLNNAIYNLISRMDAWFVAALVADKTQVNSGGGNGSFNGSLYNYEVPLSETNYLFQNAQQTLAYNLFKGRLIGIVDDKAFTLAQRLMAQGSANSTNFGFQFGNIDVMGSTRTVLGSSYNGSGVFYENGLVAIEPWIPKQNRKALDPMQAMQYNGDYGQITHPAMPGINFAIHAYSQRADNSLYGGYTQDLTMEFEVSIDLAYQSAPLSTLRGSNDSVVYAVGQLPA